MPTTIKFNIDPGVASTDIEAVHQGVAIIHNYLETNLGGDNASSWPNFTIRVFDTTSQESCCLGTSRGPTGLVEPGPRFYTLHPDWVQHNPLFPVDQFLERQNFVAHEYTHSWQAAIGCIGGHSGEPLGPWLTEGMAVYVSFAAFEQAGYTTDDDALRFHVQSILSMGSAGRPDFLEWENPDHRFPSWAYSYAYLAVRKLVSDNGGPIFLRKLCDETAKVVAVTNLRDFLNLPIILKKLGVDKQSFYKALPAYLEEMLQKYQ